jgi:hypothetical protein
MVDLARLQMVGSTRQLVQGRTGAVAENKEQMRECFYNQLASNAAFGTNRNLSDRFPGADPTNPSSG